MQQTKIKSVGWLGAKVKPNIYLDLTSIPWLRSHLLSFLGTFQFLRHLAPRVLLLAGLAIRLMVFLDRTNAREIHETIDNRTGLGFRRDQQDIS